MISLAPGRYSIATLRRGWECHTTVVSTPSFKSEQTRDMRAMCADLGVKLSIDLHTDASGAKGIAQRRGLGKLRHVEVHLLWLQHQVANGTFKIIKVDGKVNPADLLTKHLCRETMKGHMKRFHYGQEDGRAAVCPRLAIDVAVPN